MIKEVKWLMRRRWLKMLPVICIISCMLIISVTLYYKIIKSEEQRCWQLLNDSAEAVNKEINMKFDDEIEKLHLIENIILQEDMNETQLTKLHFELFKPTMIFSRIDIIYPDNTIVINNEIYDFELENEDFDSIAKKGEHISSRQIDIITKSETVYYTLPINKDGKTKVILVGVIDSKSLLNVFKPTIYDGNANICIIDSSDGNFIMDSWHEELGNVYEMEERKLKKGYENVDFHNEILTQKTGTIAFESKTTKKILYMYYMPVGEFDWSLSIFVQEDVAFSNLIYTKKVLLIGELLQIIILVIYFFWNLNMITQLENGKKEIEKQQKQLAFMSYRDMLTGLYNRNKYIDVMSYYKDMILVDMGVAYIDLNGLKQINDMDSHEAGDAMIKNLAYVIVQTFKDKTYRIGGDEFVVIDDNVEKDIFINKIETLKIDLEKEHISASIGLAWQGNCTNIENMMREAEQLMYNEKEIYYQTHDRRRE